MDKPLMEVTDITCSCNRALVCCLSMLLGKSARMGNVCICTMRTHNKERLVNPSTVLRPFFSDKLEIVLHPACKLLGKMH